MISGNEAAEIRRRMDAIERRLQSIPSRFAGGAPPALLWLRIDGGRTLNASPLVTGVDIAAGPSPTNAGAITPGTVDANGVETVAPTGTYDRGFGYGTLWRGGEIVGRVIVVHRSVSVYGYNMVARSVWVARPTSATINGVSTACYEVVAP